MPSNKAFTFVARGRVNVLHCPVDVSQASITSSSSTTKAYTAIWDTGATASVITKKIAHELNLKPIGMTQVSTAGGITDCNIYIVDIILPNDIKMMNVKVTEAPLNGFDVLIGMDIIGLGDFAVSANPNGNTMVSFRIPHDDPVDFVAQLQKRDARVKAVTKPAKSKSKLKAKHKRERQAKKSARKK